MQLPVILPATKIKKMSNSKTVHETGKQGMILEKIVRSSLLIVIVLAVSFAGCKTMNKSQEALVAIKQFQRDLLSQLRKNGSFADSVIKEVERDMDIDELKLNQSLPGTE